MKQLTLKMISGTIVKSGFGRWAKADQLYNGIVPNYDR